MLTRLSVQNLAIIESAEVEFGAGLNVITGETGAGKSVLMGALELALGARADASRLRDGAKEGRVEADFSVLSMPQQIQTRITECLENAGLPACEEGTLLIRRVIWSSGSGRVFVNDASSTVQTLRMLGKILVDIHSANANQSLLDETFQRTVLDAYGKIDLNPYQAVWHEYRQKVQALQDLQGDTTNVAQETERLSFIVSELENAQLTLEDENELPHRHQAAAYASEILSTATEVLGDLTDNEESVESLLSRVTMRIHDMARHWQIAGEWESALERLMIDVQEFSRSVQDKVSRLDADPEVFQALDARLTLVTHLKRKYHCVDVQALMDFQNETSQQLAELTGREERLKVLQQEVEQAFENVKQVGLQVTQARQKVAQELQQRLVHALKDLGFLKAGFEVALIPHEPDVTGCESIDFQFAPNPGEGARSLRAIASTGERARVMLAVKAVVAEQDAIPVLVFDEIDSNIGGETGRAVGEKLRTVAGHHQVIAITHLPQSAVYGQQHFVVAKSVEAERTISRVKMVTEEERVTEIARMLGQVAHTTVVEQHARELLAMAKNCV